MSNGNCNRGDRVASGRSFSCLRAELESTLNRWSAENGSNTPDYVLAKFIIGCLESFDFATRERDEFYDIHPYHGHGVNWVASGAIQLSDA